jgi:hypothetical protein
MIKFNIVIFFVTKIINFLYLISINLEMNLALNLILFVLIFNFNDNLNGLNLQLADRQKRSYEEVLKSFRNSYFALNKQQTSTSQATTNTTQATNNTTQATNNTTQATNNTTQATNNTTQATNNTTQATNNTTQATNNTTQATNNTTQATTITSPTNIAIISYILIFIFIIFMLSIGFLITFFYLKKIKELNDLNNTIMCNRMLAYDKAIKRFDSELKKAIAINNISKQTNPNDFDNISHSPNVSNSDDSFSSVQKA